MNKHHFPIKFLPFKKNSNSSSNKIAWTCFHWKKQGYGDLILHLQFFAFRLAHVWILVPDVIYFMFSQHLAVFDWFWLDCSRFVTFRILQEHLLFTTTNLLLKCFPLHIHPALGSFCFCKINMKEQLGRTYTYILLQVGWIATILNTFSLMIEERK